MGAASTGTVTVRGIEQYRLHSQSVEIDALASRYE
jgi:hypothetical protein